MLNQYPLWKYILLVVVLFFASIYALPNVYGEDPAVQISHRTKALTEEDKLAVQRARKIQRFLSQPFFVAEVFTGAPGKYVSLKDTLAGFKAILAGEYDHLPEQAFYMVGGIEEAAAKEEG